MKIIGITGGVGSGKSVVLSILKDEFSASVYEADKLVHVLMKKGEPLYFEYVDLFGKEILDKDEEIDHKKVAAAVFNDPGLLIKLNKIVHPAVKVKILDLIEEERKKDTELFVIEAALLIQDGYKDICDEIWFIHVPHEIRIERLMSSRGYSYEKCKSILENQPASDFYYKGSDRVIENDGKCEDLVNKIGNILHKY